MGLCLSVSMWKDKGYADRARGDGKKAVVEKTCEVEETGGDGGSTPVRPIWQRKVMMGVKCQLPRFSGLMLYDEYGRPLCRSTRDRAREQGKHAAAITVLKEDLL